jgi:single-strand DNA-binding protein
VAGNPTDDPEVRYTESGIARAVFRVAVSGRREQEASFFTVIVLRDQAEHAAGSLAKGSRVVVIGQLQQRAWTAEDGSARSVMEVVAEELGPSLRWPTARPEWVTRSTTKWRSRPTSSADLAWVPSGGPTYGEPGGRGTPSPPSTTAAVRAAWRRSGRRGPRR